MKTKVFITAITLLGLQAFAETPTTTAACPACCPPPSATDSGAIQGYGQEWLNIDTVTLEAANGDPIAQYTLAYLTDTGTQTPQDKDKAAAMYAAAKPGLEKAAKDGNSAACHALSHMCKMGNGCAKDPEKAKMYADMATKCCTPSTTPTATPVDAPADDMTTEDTPDTTPAP